MRRNEEATILMTIQGQKYVKKRVYLHRYLKLKEQFKAKRFKVYEHAGNEGLEWIWEETEDKKGEEFEGKVIRIEPLLAGGQQQKLKETILFNKNISDRIELKLE